MPLALIKKIPILPRKSANENWYFIAIFSGSHII
jgi:hypothetical protein